MPELPEVEVVKRGLEPLLVGRQIQQCSFSGHPLRLPLQRTLFNTWIRKATVLSIKRRAKYIIIALDTQANLIVHLGMTGKLGLFEATTPKNTHDHACFALNNGLELRFNDVRRFGSLQVVSPEDDLETLFQHIGPEPFGSGFTAAYLVQKAKKRKQPVKNFIMDSRIIAGIGNIYANEILFDSGIRPDKATGEISAPQWERLVDNTRSVLKRAIRAGGSTIADFVGSSGEKGYFQLQLNVYGKQGQACPTCNHTIVRTIMAGRATFFCQSCQK